jgi:hypothetical protein
MRRDSEEEPVEEDEHFDVDEYVAPDSEEIEVVDRGTYFEDGDLYAEGDEEEEKAKPPAEEKEPREPSEPLGPRLKAAWSDLLVEARKIELPGAPDTRRKQVATVVAIVLASVLVGTGAFLLGKGSGTDVEQAKLGGAAAGKQAGAIEGAARGYSAGFRKGQARGFRKAYVPAYRLYYKRAFEQAGLDVPGSRQIEVPLP